MPLRNTLKLAQTPSLQQWSCSYRKPPSPEAEPDSLGNQSGKFPVQTADIRDAQDKCHTAKYPREKAMLSIFLCMSVPSPSMVKPVLLHAKCGGPLPTQQMCQPQFFLFPFMSFELP